MNHSHARLAALLAALACASCETIDQAPKGSPRVELEVTVNVDASYSGKLAGVGDDLARAIADLVLTKADLGLRFYPVLSRQYGPKDARPEYLLIVDVRDLDVQLQQQTAPRDGSEPQVEASIKQLDCWVTATLSKRRTTGPALLVGRSESKGSAIVANDQSAAAKQTYTLKRANAEKPAPPLLHTDLVRATEKGLGSALTGLLIPVDRELALRHGAGAPAASPR